MLVLLGMGSDPNSIRSVDPDSKPDPDPGGQKLLTKIGKIQKFHVLKCWMFSFEVWTLKGFFCSLDVLYEGRGTDKSQLFFFFIKL